MTVGRRRAIHETTPVPAPIVVVVIAHFHHSVRTIELALFCDPPPPFEVWKWCHNMVKARQN